MSSKFAWVTYVNTAEYMSAALTLHRSLQLVGTTYPFIIMMPEDSNLYSKCNNETKSLLIVHQVPEIDRVEPRHSSPRFASCINKLHIWNLTSYDKVCWLDSDMIALKNIDHLFDIPFGTNKIAACSGCLCNVYDNPKFVTKPDKCPFVNANNVYINAGLMVIIPDAKMFEILLHQDYNYPMPEQDVMSDVLQSYILTLPSTYNYLNHLDLIHPEIDHRDVHIFHFGYDKPWNAQGRVIHKKYYDYWHHINNEVEK